MKRLLISTAFLLALTGTAMAQNSSVGTGQWLHDEWLGYHRFSGQGAATSTDTLKDLAKGGFYEGFILGTMDAGLKIVKVPVGVSISQMADAVGKYLDNHHEVWSQPAGMLVLEILRHSFPPTDGKAEFGLSGSTLHQYWLASKRLKAAFRTKAPSVKESEFFHAMLYSGYVAAVNTISPELLKRGFVKDVPPEQIETVVGKYLDNHTEQWHQPAASMVIRALLSAFPGKHD